LLKTGTVDLNESSAKKGMGLGLEINLNSEEKLPEINLKQNRNSLALKPGKGGNPFMNRNVDGSIDKKPVHHYNST
jgi:hypothetical protein